MCGVREEVGENRSLPDILCVVSSPSALLKVFPLRACASLNVVIMQSVFLFPSLPVADTTAAETFGNLEDSPTHVCPLQRSSRQPFLPRAGQSLRTSLGACGSHTWSPFRPSHWEAATYRNHSCEPVTHDNQPMLPSADLSALSNYL